LTAFSRTQEAVRLRHPASTDSLDPSPADGILSWKIIAHQSGF
jgi:hypothetical protein